MKPIASFTVVLAAAVAPAWAARPLDTDDAGVIASGICELEAARVVARAAGVSARETSAALSCGIGLGSQLGLATALARAEGSSARSAALLGKTELWAGEGDGAPALSVGWSLGWSRNPGESWQHDATEARLLYTQPLGAHIVHLNLGHGRDRVAGTRSTLWGVAWELQPLPAGPLAWAPLAELFGDDHGDRSVNVGVRVTLLPEKLFVDIAWARQLVGEKARAVNAGLKWAF